LRSKGSLWYFPSVASETRKSVAVRSRRPKDKDAATKLRRLMDNMGLSPEVLGAQTGVSGKRIRQILETHVQPERRIRYALARRFDLLPAHIWKADMVGLTANEIQHMLELARREDRERQAVAA
jgi:hypothetical protein